MNITFIKPKVFRKTVRVLGFKTEKCQCGCGVTVLCVHALRLGDNVKTTTSYENFRKMYMASPRSYVTH
jgi:hypothetical protein